MQSMIDRFKTYSSRRVSSSKSGLSASWVAPRTATYSIPEVIQVLLKTQLPRIPWALEYVLLIENQAAAGNGAAVSRDTGSGHGVDDDPNETWTRIVARVNEAVQPFAPAKEPSGPTN